ncbi:unnamed protein product, partial [Polarella glacialis]
VLPPPRQPLTPEEWVELRAQRARALQRVWLRTRAAGHLEKIRRLPVILDLSGTGSRKGGENDSDEEADPWRDVPPMGVDIVKAALNVAYSPGEALRHRGQDLFSIVWLLLYFGIRRRSGLPAVRAALEACPIPSLLPLVRRFGYCQRGGHFSQRREALDLEEALLQALSRIRGCELERMQGFYADPTHAPGQDSASEDRAADDADQLEVLDRRARMLESLYSTAPKVWIAKVSVSEDWHPTHGVLSRAPADTVCRGTLFRSRQLGHLMHREGRP